MKKLNYFDEYLPSYSIVAYQPILRYLKRKKIKSLLEVGSGTGESLKLLNKSLGCDVFGLEPAESYKKIIDQKNENKIYWTSILNGGDLRKIKAKFDVVLISRVLHHLISNSPNKSSALSKRALKNAFQLLNQNGEIVIFEPIFEPKCFSRLLFYLKKSVSKITSKRVMFFGYWNSIGEPVVNYFSRRELLSILPDGEIKQIKVFKRNKPSFLIGLFFSRYDILIVVGRGRQT